MIEPMCPVCSRAESRIEQRADVSAVSCKRCGEYKITHTLLAILRSQKEFGEVRPYLSAHLRQASKRGEEIRLDSDNWRAFAEAHRHTSIPMQMDMLLRLLAEGARPLGTTVEFSPDEYPLIDAANWVEANYLAGTLVDQGLVAKVFANKYLLTTKGWERLLPSAAGGKPGTCFVAMSFDPSMNSAFSEGILPAVQIDCGYHVLRVDREPHNDSIDDRIIAGIRSAQFVVADFTLQRQGVYYEAGFAQGLGRTVVRTCRDNDIEKLHFDTRQFFHLKWTAPAGLRASLANHIQSTIGAFGSAAMSAT